LYKFTGQKWSNYPQKFYIHSDGSGLPADDVLREINLALGAWDDEVAASLFVSEGTSDPILGGNRRNDIYWVPFDDTRIIATTTLIGDQNGILEADIQMNSLIPWGIDIDGESMGYVMTDRYDVRNIATHETGHAFGLADLYESSAADLTMYGYSSRGQTKKISLGYGDILGIRALYGA
jgi:hypothetical protein